MNFRKGFNRVYIVLCGLWLIYSLVVYPLHKINEARAVQLSTVASCLGSYNTPKLLEACEKSAEGEFNAAADPYTFPGYWFQPIVWLFVVLVPALIYALLRGIVFVVSWVARGFKS
jgi:hypothetical protein